MAEVTKEILAELGVFGLTLPRNLNIPKMTVPPASDLLNIQFTVMEMLVDDPEIAPVVANHWNLGLEIRAFNVQNQVWDVLELDTDIELPARASIQIIVRNNEPVLDQAIPDPEPVFTSKRDPRRKHITPVTESKAVSKRDPRRKHREPPDTPDTVGRFPDTSKIESSNRFIPSKRDPRKRSQAVVAEIEAVKSISKPQEVVNPVTKAPPILISEPNIRNLSKNDPRRKRLLEKSKAQISSMSSRSTILSPQSTQNIKVHKNKVQNKTVDNDSDSDEGNLQIDESFEEKSSKESSDASFSLLPNKVIAEPARISESQLADSGDMVGKKTESKACVDDVGLWDEIYGITTETNSSLNIYDPNPAVKSSNVNVKQMAKSIGLETMNKKCSGLSKKASSSSGRISNISLEGKMKISVGQEKQKNLNLGIGKSTSLAIDLTESSNELEITKTESKTVEQLEIERELLLNLVKERDRMNEIVAGIPLPDEIIFDKEIEEGELSDTPDNSDSENVTSNKDTDDFFSPESPKGLQIDMDTEESEIDIIPLEREEVLLKHKKNVSKRKTLAKAVAEEDSDIEEIPLEIPKTRNIKPSEEHNIKDIEKPDKFKKYWADFPEEVNEKPAIDKDLKSGLRKLSDIKSKEKANKSTNLDWALKTVRKTLTESKSEESAPSQNFWKGASAQLSSYSEKIRQKVQERRSESAKEKNPALNGVVNSSFKGNDSEGGIDPADIQLPLPSPAPAQPIRKSGGLLEFPPPVNVLPKLPQSPQVDSSLSKSNRASPDKTNLPPPPVPGVFNSSIPPPVATFGFPPPSKPAFPAPPPLLIPNFPPPTTAFPPPPPAASVGFPPFNASAGPEINLAAYGKSIESSPKATSKVPSLLEMKIPKPSGLESDNKQSDWLDPLLPQGRQGKGSKTGSSGTRSEIKSDDKGRHIRERRSHERENHRRRSRSRDRRSEERIRRRSGERDGRSSDRDRRRRRTRSRSRSRDRVRARESRRPQSERRGSQDSSSSQDSGIRRDRDKTSQDKDTKITKNEREYVEKDVENTEIVFPVKDQYSELKSNSTSESQEDRDRDNVMLCFYEGEDCMDDPGDPDADDHVPENVVEKEGPNTAELKPPPAFGIASCLTSLMESRDSKQLFPEPVPAISATVATGPTETTPAPPAPPSISGNTPPTRGEIITASLGLADKHPVSAVYEYSNRMKFKKPWFEERWGPGGGWAYAVTIGENTYSSPWFKPKKRDAKMEACRYALQQLGIFNKISS